MTLLPEAGHLVIARDNANSFFAQSVRDGHALRGKLWRGWWRNAPLGGLLECVGKYDQPRLAAGTPGEAHAERRGLGVEAFGKAPNDGRIDHHGEWHDHGRMARARRERGAKPAGKQQRVKSFGAHDLVDAVRGGEGNILGAVLLIAGAIGFDVDLIRSVELQLPVLEGASLDMREVPLAQLGQRLYRRSGTEACEPLVEVAFHPVLGNDRAAGVRARLCADAIAILPVQIVP